MWGAVVTGIDNGLTPQQAVQAAVNAADTAANKEAALANINAAVKEAQDAAAKEAQDAKDAAAKEAAAKDAQDAKDAKDAAEANAVAAAKDAQANQDAKDAVTAVASTSDGGTGGGGVGSGGYSGPAAGATSAGSAPGPSAGSAAGPASGGEGGDGGGSAAGGAARGGMGFGGTGSGVGGDGGDGGGGGNTGRGGGEGGGGAGGGGDGGGGNGPTCFVKGSLVTLADGRRIAIEDVAVGDFVLGQGGSNEVVAHDRPQLIIPDVRNGTLYGINGSKKFITSEHPVMTKDGWKAIDQENAKKFEPHLSKILVGSLTVGDLLVKEGGELMLVTSIDKYTDQPQQQLYNLMLNGDHTYYVNEMLVHNKD